MFYKSILLLAVLTTNTANAEVFVRVDALGNVTYTNLSVDDIGKKTVVDKEVVTPEKSSADVEVFKVTKQVQAKRDNMREEILHSELKSESEALEQSKLNKDQTQIDMHTRNISLLKKELGVNK